MAHLDRTGVLESLGNLGQTGVWLFFTLSGFLIGTKWFREEARTGRVNWRNFMVRRALRILPLYVVVLTGYVLLVPHMEKDPARLAEFNANLPYFCTFTFNIVAHPSITSAIFYYSWSLSAEEQFYLAFPVLYRLLKGKWLAGIAACLVVWSYLSDLGWITFPVYGSLLQKVVVAGVVEPIIFGVGLAAVLHHPRCFERLNRFGSRGWFTIFLLVTWGFVVERHATDWVYGKWTIPFIHLGLCGLVLTTVLLEVKGERVLSGAWLRYLGKISYGLYLLHIPVRSALEAAFPTQAGLFLNVAMIGIAVALASLSYTYFETPILRLKSRFS